MMEPRRYPPKPKVEEKVDYGDFLEVKDENAEPGQDPNAIQMPVRVRMPRENQFIGVVVQRFGGNKMEIKCSDGKNRNCRVPGRFSRTLWLRPKDIVLIETWELDRDKGDVIFKYDGSAINQLRKRGLLDNLKEVF